MRTKIMIMVAALALATPAFAQVDCGNIPDSAGAVPQEYIDACYTGRSGGTMGDAPTDNAWGPESQTLTLNSMVLNVPDVLTSVGPVDFTNFVGGCDFANNDFSQLFCADTANLFFHLSTTNATRTDIGPLNPPPPGGETISGLAWDQLTGTMFACSTSVATSTLLTIDITTGATTTVGPITGSAAMIACAVDPAGNIWGYDIVDDNLYAINKTTGAGTIVGPLAFDANFGQGMDFDHDDGTCYLFAFNNTAFQSELRTCDTATGATTFVGVIGSTTPGGLTQVPGAGIGTLDVPVQLQSFDVE